MIPYLLLIAIPSVFLLVWIDRTSSRRTLRVALRHTPAVKENNLALPVFFAVLLALLVCRHETIGRDLHAYEYYFDIYPYMDIEDFDLFREESLFRLLNWAVGQIDHNFQLYIAAVAVITIIPIACVYCEDRRNSYLKIVVFLSMSTFVMLFSGLRQMMTIACAMIAYRFVREKKVIPFLLMALIGYGFHHSAFMILLLYPLYHARFKKNHLWIIVPLAVASFVLNNQIFMSLQMFMQSISDRYEYEATETGAFMSLVLFLMFAVFAYVVPDESKMDQEMFGLRNYLVAAVFFQCFAPVHTLAMRMNYYFIIFIPIALAKLIAVPKPGMEKVARFALIVLSLFFTYDFVKTVYDGAMTGISLLDTIPYRPFWR